MALTSNQAYNYLDESAAPVSNQYVDNDLSVGNNIVSLLGNGLGTVQFTITHGSGDTTADSAATNFVPAGFYPLTAVINPSRGTTSSVTFDDLGPTGDANGFIDDGALVGTAALMQAGTTFCLPCNGAQALIPKVANTQVPAVGNQALRSTLSGTPGAGGVTLRITLFGLVQG